MPGLTRTELEALRTLIEHEAALHQKFASYAASCEEEHVTKLCRRLAERSREHLTALADAVRSAGGPND